MSLKQFIVDNGNINLATIGQGFTYSGGTFSNAVRVQGGLLLNPILVEDASIVIDQPDINLFRVFLNIQQNVTSFSMPNLTTLTSTGQNLSSALLISNNSILDSISIPSLSSLQNVYINGNILLTSLDISGLTHSVGFYLTGNTSLTQSTFSLIDVGGSIQSAGVSITNNSLISLDLSTLISATAVSITEGNLTSLNLSNLSTVNSDLGISGCNFTSLTLNSLATSGGVYIVGNLNLISLTMSALTSVDGSTGVQITGNTSLTSIDISSLTSIAGGAGITITEFAGTTIDISALVNTDMINIFGNSTLTSIDISAACTCLYLDFSGNALDATSVNNILIDLDTVGQSAGSVDLSGGTNAAPSGAGITAAANLVINGWTVITN